MPGTIAGTEDFRHISVDSATSSTLACSSQPLPETTIDALRMVPSSITFWLNSASNSERNTTSVTSKQVSMSWSPSMITSGSTIGTRPCSWHSAA